MRALLIVGALLLTGCDTAELQRIRAEANLSARIRIHCVPEKPKAGEEQALVSVRWVKGKLVCRHYTPLIRYIKKQPHVEVREHVVATAGEFE